MKADNRPLSPHLQVYKPQLTSILSITHRATGVFLSIGTLLITWWLVALASGPEYFTYVQDWIGSPIGYLALIGWTFAVFYHMSNGVRHLFWDMGKGFELETVYKSGYAVVASAVTLTVIAWAVALAAL